MSEDWIFIEQDEDKTCWWMLYFPEHIDCDAAQSTCLVIWPEIKSDGSSKFSFGTSYEEGNYYEFEYSGTRLTLTEAKSAAKELLIQLPIVKSDQE